VGANRFEGAGKELLADKKVADLYLGGTARIERAEPGAAGGGAAGT
jgi:hypothetical protein